jgi:hypothetical protein
VIRGLIEKECRQHATLLVFLMLLLGAGLFALTSNKIIINGGGSVFFMISQLWFWIFPLASLVLATGLVSSEFRNRTQLFLEGLPMQRWLMLLVKYLLGLGILMTCTVVLLTVAWWKGRHAEAMTLNFSMLLLVKLVGWSWFCWAVCFAHGFLGRYRVWSGAGLVLGLMLLQQTGGVLVTEFGPFDLISDRFAYERFVWPTEALWITAGLILGLTGAGFALGLARDTTLASMLSEKMSMREKVVFTIMALAALFAVGSYQQRLESQKRLVLPGAVDFQQGVAIISAAAAVIAPTPEEEKALEEHGRKMSEMLGQMAVYLDCKTLPPVFLIHRSDFTDRQVEIYLSESTKGVVARYNFLTLKDEEAELRGPVVRAVLMNHQWDRLASDTRDWVLEGFAAWWPVREQAKTPADFIKLRAALGEPPHREIRGHDLKNWLKVKTELGPKQPATCTGLGIIALGDYGDEARRRFLAAVLGYSAPKDVRASLHDWSHPVEGILKSTTGADFNALAAKWNAAMPTQKPTP